MVKQKNEEEAKRLTTEVFSRPLFEVTRSLSQQGTATTTGAV